MGWITGLGLRVGIIFVNGEVVEQEGGCESVDVESCSEVPRDWFRLQDG